MKLKSIECNLFCVTFRGTEQERILTSTRGFIGSLFFLRPSPHDDAATFLTPSSRDSNFSITNGRVSDVPKKMKIFGFDLNFDYLFLSLLCTIILLLPLHKVGGFFSYSFFPSFWNDGYPLSNHYSSLQNNHHTPSSVSSSFS